jgi:hypothetical protein
MERNYFCNCCKKDTLSESIGFEELPQPLSKELRERFIKVKEKISVSFEEVSDLELVFLKNNPLERKYVFFQLLNPEREETAVPFLELTIQEIKLLPQKIRKALTHPSFNISLLQDLIFFADSGVCNADGRGCPHNI